MTGQLFCRTYGCGATGLQSCPIFGFCPLFPIYNPLNVPSGEAPTAQELHRRMILIYPCGCRRSKGVPSGTGVFLRLVRGAVDPKLAKIFAYGKWLYPYRMLLHGASNLDQRCLKTRNCKDGCTFGGLKNVPLYFSGFARDFVSFWALRVHDQVNYWKSRD